MKFRNTLDVFFIFTLPRIDKNKGITHIWLERVHLSKLRGKRERQFQKCTWFGLDEI